MTEAARSEPPPPSHVERRRRGNGSNARPKWIHFRVSSELYDALEAVQRKLATREVPASISSLARSILHQHVGTDPVMAEVEESIAAVWAITQETVGEMINKMHTELPDKLRAGVRRYYERRTDRHARVAAG